METRTIANEISFFLQRVYDRCLTTATGGNISVRSGETFYITPRGKDKGRGLKDEIAQIRLTDFASLRACLPSCEFRMHGQIYRERQEVNAIIHAHPTYSSIFCLLEKELDVSLLSEAELILKKIDYVDYFPPSTEELSKAVAHAACYADVLFLRRHGLVLLGADLTECYQKLEVAEHLAKISYLLLANNLWGMVK